jgi:NTP pyrophosphatase (non-canonical NTP hydrolase)
MTAAVRSNPDLRRIQRESIADSRRWFPDLHDTLDHQATHFTLGLLGEAGEVANLVKKVKRGDTSWAEMTPRLADEMADVLTYLCDFAATLGIDLADEWAKKRLFNEERFGGEPS